MDIRFPTKEHITTVRLSDDDAKTLERLSRKLKLRQSDVIRLGIQQLAKVKL